MFTQQDSRVLAEKSIEPNSSSNLETYHAEHVALGKTYFATEKFDLAILEFTRALTYQEDYPTLLLRAKAHEKLQQYEEALLNYESVLAIKKNHVEALTQAAVICTKLDESSKAKTYMAQAMAARKKTREELPILVEDYRKELANNLAHKKLLTTERKILLASDLPEQLTQLLLLGNEYMKDNLPDAAIEQHNKALQLCDFDFISLTSRAQAYAFKREYDQALQDFSAALQLSDFYLIYWQRGVLFYDRGQNSLAKEDFENYVIFAARLGFRNMNKERQYFVLRVINEAEASDAEDRIEDFHTMSQEQFEAKVVDAIAQKNHQHALDLLTLAIKANPKDGISYAKKAQIYEADGNHEKALLNYSLALWVSEKKYFESFFARRMKLNFTLGRYTEAFADLNNLKIYSSTPAGDLEVVFAHECYNFALEEMRRGNIETSIILYSYAIYYVNYIADYYFDRAIAFSQQHLFDDAEQDFLDACELEPKHPRKLTVKKQMKLNERQAQVTNFRLQKIANQQRVVQKKDISDVTLSPKIIITKTSTAQLAAKKPKANAQVNRATSSDLLKQNHLPRVDTHTLSPALSTDEVDAVILHNNKKQRENVVQNGDDKPSSPAIMDYKKLRERDNQARLEKYQAQQRLKKNLRVTKSTMVTKPAAIAILRPELTIELPPSPSEESPVPVESLKKIPAEKTCMSAPSTNLSPTLFQFRGTPNPLINLIFKDGAPAINHRIDLHPAELHCLIMLNTVGHATCIGGSILDRVLKVPMEKIENFNIITDVAPQKIIELFKNFPGYFHDPYLPALFKLRIYQNNKTKHTIEIFSSANFNADNSPHVSPTDFTCDTLSIREPNFFVGMGKVCVHDPLNSALVDILTHQLKTQGSSLTCFTNHPINILRAVYKSTRYNFEMSHEFIRAIQTSKNLLSAIKPEIINSLLRRKLFSRGLATANFNKLCTLDLLTPLFSNIQFSLLNNIAWLTAELTLLDARYQSQQEPTFDMLPQIYALFVATAMKDLNLKLAEAKAHIIDPNPCLAASLSHRYDLIPLLTLALDNLSADKQALPNTDSTYATSCKI